MLLHLLTSNHLGVFVLAALVLAFSPGPGILYVLARTLSGGRSEGIASVLGTTLGGLVHVLLAALGLSALLAASAQAFLVIKYVGAAYLVFLGVRALLQARAGAALLAAQVPQTRANPRHAFYEGILTESLNVKTALFFLAFIPQFIDHRVAPAPQFAFFGLICLVLNGAADLCVVLLATRLSAYFKSAAGRGRVLQYGSGTMLLGLGAYVALSDTRR
jgi:threonine/homoserine/homoserine lactone efflux protein